MRSEDLMQFYLIWAMESDQGPQVWTWTVIWVKQCSFTAVSTKAVPQKCKSVRNNANLHYG